VEAENYQGHPERRDDDGPEQPADGRQVEDQIEEFLEQVGDDGSDGADDQIAGDDSCRDGNERHEEHLEGVRNPALDPMLDLRAEPYHEQDRYHGARIAGGRHDDRQAEERGIPGERSQHAEVNGAEDLAGGKGHHRRIDKRNADGQAVELTHLELPGRRHAKDDGEKVEEAVRDGI